MASYPTRLILYGVVTIGVFELSYALLCAGGVAWLAEENGLLELTQVGFLLAAVAGFTWAAVLSPADRNVLIITGCLILYAAARESDTWFETMLFDDAYKWLVGFPAAIVILFVLYKNRGQMLEDTLRIAMKPSLTLFAIGGIYLCFFCQIADRPMYWYASGSADGGGLQKSLVEENAELFAYLLIVFSSVEAVISAYQQRVAQQRSNTIETEIDVREQPVRTAA